MGFDTKILPNYSQASFATPEEIFKFPKIELSEPTADNGGGIILHSDGVTAYVDDSDNSTLTIGSIGSKKTRNVVMPHIISAAKSGISLVIHAPKADILKTVSLYLTNQGYKIRILDFREPQRGERYNPLEVAAKEYKNGNINRARELFMHFSMTICDAVKSEKDPFWHLTAARYMAGLAELLCILGSSAEEVTIDNIYNLHLQSEEKIGGSTYIKTYFKEHPDERCWKLIYPFVTAPTDTKNSLDAVFTSAIVDFIQNDSIVDQTSNSTFTAEDLLEKTALFIISRDEGAVYDALISAIVDQMYSVLTDIAEKNGGSLDRRVSFILDEFGNMAALSDIQKKLTLSRARGITWHFVVQSLEMLVLVYGDKCAQIIIENCNNIIYLYSPDIKLVKYISDLCGEKEGLYNPDSRIPLCSVDMLKHLEKGEALMLIDRMRPFVTRLPDISQYYGVESLERVDVPEREKQELKCIDFKEIVEEMLTEKVLETTRKDAEEHENARKKNEEEAKTLISTDRDNIILIIDRVISNLY